MSRTHPIHLGKRKTICEVSADDDFLKGWVNAFWCSYYSIFLRITHINNSNQIQGWVAIWEEPYICLPAGRAAISLRSHKNLVTETLSQGIRQRFRSFLVREFHHQFPGLAND